MAPHSDDPDFLLLIEKYRGILRQWTSCRRWGDVEEALFDRLGRPAFFEEAVQLVLEGIQSQLDECAIAQQSREIEQVIRSEVRRVYLLLEERFVKSGELELPSERKTR